MEVSMEKLQVDFPVMFDFRRVMKLQTQHSYCRRDFVNQFLNWFQKGVTAYGWNSEIHPLCYLCFFLYNQYNHQAWLVWCKKWQTDDGQAAHDDYPLNAANPMPWWPSPNPHHFHGCDSIHPCVVSFWHWVYHGLPHYSNMIVGHIPMICNS